jgi:hypothetical protein
MSSRDLAETKETMLSSNHLHKVAAAGGDLMQRQGSVREFRAIDARLLPLLALAMKCAKLLK